MPISTLNDFSTAPIQLTDTQQAFNKEKQQLANEYVAMVHGAETMRVYEQHMTNFMLAHHMGNTAILSKVLAQGNQRKAAYVSQSMLKNGMSPSCISITSKGVQATCQNPTYAAQFPEEQSNWCGNASAATILVEDSFAWPGTNMHGSDTLSYDPYITSQPYAYAYQDEHLLAGPNYFNNPSNQGADPGPMTTVLNMFIGGKGGWYNEETNFGNFQNDIVADIGTGWDLNDGISLYVDASASRIFHYPAGVTIAHWLPITYDTNGGTTTYYADPVYNSPDYSSASGWNPNGPYASISTSTLMSYSFVFIW